MNKKKYFNNFIALTLVFLLLIPFLFLRVNKSVLARAEEVVKYSTALDDLSKSGDFSESNFPKVSNDFSIQIITIAESSDKELFIYVYQPSAYSVKLSASSVNISTGIEDNLSYTNYKLEELSSEGVYQKYLVKDFVVSDDPIRYYNISSIYRPFDSALDEGSPDYNENLTSEKSFNVSKIFTAITENGNVTYSFTKTETVLITDKYVGFLEYSNGFQLLPSWCRSHYVAFSTDYEIEKLLEADVYFVKQDVTYSFVPFKGEEYFYGPSEEKYAYLTYTQEVVHEGTGLFAKTYEWDRIESVSDFVSKLRSLGAEIGCI